jgi:hypothetical protein
MSPDGVVRPVKTVAENNLYTVILAMAFAVILVTSAFVAYKCYTQYGTFFSVGQ